MFPKKNCLYCEEEIVHKDWARRVLHPTEQLWTRVRFCDMNCAQRCRQQEYKKIKQKVKQDEKKMQTMSKKNRTHSKRTK
jgi:hypothetical protein